MVPLSSPVCEGTVGSNPTLSAMTTTDPAAGPLVAALTPHPPRALGSLRVWGDWFGKPLDNLHVVVGAQLDGHGTLVLEFNNHEVLRVARPRGWIVDATASEGSRVC